MSQRIVISQRFLIIRVPGDVKKTKCLERSCHLPQKPLLHTIKYFYVDIIYIWYIYILGELYFLENMYSWPQYILTQPTTNSNIVDLVYWNILVYCIMFLSGKPSLGSVSECLHPRTTGEPGNHSDCPFVFISCTDLN